MYKFVYVYVWYNLNIRCFLKNMLTILRLEFVYISAIKENYRVTINLEPTKLTKFL